MQNFPLNADNIGLLLAGLSLFLYGIIQMSSGLEKAASSRLRDIFEKNHKLSLERFDYRYFDYSHRSK